MIDYAVVTAARNEGANLRRLGKSLADQHVRPSAWVIVENDSTDDTLAIATELARTNNWIRVISLAERSDGTRGAPIVRALRAGLESLGNLPEIIVNVDADVSFGADFFERLLNEFASEPRLGIASGSAFEMKSGDWAQVFTTRTSVWGATRAWRRRCLEDVLPLEERVGWDGIDECKANARGWQTRTFLDLAFFHHRPEGSRDGSLWQTWQAQGEVAHYLSYRPSYLLARVLFRVMRHPAAAAMLWGYGRCVLRREARCTDLPARAYLRSQQSWRKLPMRLREARGLPAT